MQGHLPSRLYRWRYHALMLVLTFAGLNLIRAGLAYSPEPTPVPQVRQPAASLSERGGRPSGSLQAVAGASLEGPSPAPEATQEATATLIPPTPAPTPTPPRTEVITYTVVQGDTLWDIAKRFDINLDTIIWANERLELDPDLISIGDQINILPVIGVWHTVRAGDTLESIAAYYKVTPDKITGYAPNRLDPSAPLEPGRKLIIPGGEKPFEAHIVYTEGGAVTLNAPAQPGRFIWPCTGAITTPYSKYHLALDIANEAGTPIYAAASGTVVQAGELGTLGLNVQIDHGNGFQSYYGHMQKILVQEGQWVQQGQQIGEMGSTGKSTGPHVHFIIRLYGGAVNPARYLPR